MKTLITVALLLVNSVLTGASAPEVALPPKEAFPIGMANGVIWESASQRDFLVSYNYTLIQVDTQSSEWIRNRLGFKEISKEAVMVMMEKGYHADEDFAKLLDTGFRFHYTYKSLKGELLFAFTIKKSDLDL